MLKLLLLIANTLLAFITAFLLWGSIETYIKSVSFRIVILYLLALGVSSIVPFVLTYTKKIRLFEALGITLLLAIVIGTILIGTAFEFRNF